MLLDQTLSRSKVKLSRRCIYDERVDSIVFDADGVCNYCHQVERLKAECGTGMAKGEETFHSIVAEIKAVGKGKRYDCVVGVSGGRDSSYLVYLAKELGLRPLAVHYDNRWNSAIATRNIRKVLSALYVDLYTHVIDNKESDDIFRAFFLAGYPRSRQLLIRRSPKPCTERHGSTE